MYIWNRFQYLALFIMLAACTHDNKNDLKPQQPECKTEGITYESNIKQIINTNCAVTGCHVAGTNRKDLTTYVLVKQAEDLIHEKAIHERSMPPNKPLSECEFNQLSAWLHAGTPEK